MDLYLMLSIYFPFCSCGHTIGSWNTYTVRINEQQTSPVVCTTPYKMQTRNQFLTALAPLTNLPEDIESEGCPICTEEFSDPVELCPKHVFCQGCVIKWLTRRKRNTCPICRRVLFTLTETGRWTFGADRIRILAQTMEHSRLLTDNFDEYGYFRWTTSEVHRAAAAAHSYLAEDSHARITEGKAVIDIRVIGPHMIAMGNMLREYARATNRGYSAHQRRDWKITVERVWKFLSHMDGWVFEGDDLVHMAQDFRLATFFSLQEEKIDARSSRFFEVDAPLESPSGDLDLLLDYIVFQCTKTYEQREVERAAHQRAQQEALQNETSRLGWVLRWTGQRFFDGL